MMMLQNVASVPEANWTDLFGSSSIVYPHSGRQLAHPAHLTAALHFHAGEHTRRTGGTYSTLLVLRLVKLIISSHVWMNSNTFAGHSKNFIQFIHSFKRLWASPNGNQKQVIISAR